MIVVITCFLAKYYYFYLDSKEAEKLTEVCDCKTLTGIQGLDFF